MYPLKLRVFAILLSWCLLAGCRLGDPAVDRYGQNARAFWWGKIQDDRTAIKILKEEAASWKTAPDGLDRYGGTLDSPVFQATGHFRTQKVSGRWWLITPEGHRFYSIGVDLISAAHATVITGRRGQFKALPASTRDGSLYYTYDPYDHTRQMFDFYRANLDRFHDPSSGMRPLDAWRDRVHRRLNDWGFNTIGNWSERKLREAGRLPYTTGVTLFEPTYRVRGETDFLDVPTFGSGKYRFADVFSPRYRKHALEYGGVFSDPGTRRSALDPWCIGVFADNEIPWTGGLPAERHALTRAIFAKDAPAAAKKAFWRRLEERYGDLPGINAAWDTSFSGSITDLAARSVTLPENENDALKKDLEDLTGFFAERYFSTVRKAFHRHMPWSLYLGSRFDAGTPQVVRNVAGRSMDVISVNTYERDVAAAPHIRVPVDKPLLVSEFHFGATDQGALHGGVITVRTQKKRAIAYTAFAESVLRDPSFVGFHWFQYVDQPMTGRTMDGEDFNCGLVNTLDLPYSELTRAARVFNRSVYDRLAKEPKKDENRP